VHTALDRYTLLEMLEVFPCVCVCGGGGLAELSVVPTNNTNSPTYNQKSPARRQTPPPPCEDHLVVCYLYIMSRFSSYVIESRVCFLQEDQSVCVIWGNIAAYRSNQTEQIYILCGKNAQYSVKCVGTCTNQ
jgi:hypothetical protein